MINNYRQTQIFTIFINLFFSIFVLFRIMLVVKSQLTIKGQKTYLRTQLLNGYFSGTVRSTFKEHLLIPCKMCNKGNFIKLKFLQLHTEQNGSLDGADCLLFEGVTVLGVEPQTKYFPIRRTYI